MFPMWATLCVGIWLLMAPLILGYQALTPILHDALAGLVVCLAALAASQWPRARLALAIPGLWLVVAPRVLGHGQADATATEVASGLAVTVLMLLPTGIPQLRGPKRAAK